MAQVESKSSISIDIEVKARKGEKKGHLSITSGNLYYYRTNAKSETKRYTFLQLIDLIEKDIEDQ